MLRKSKSRFKFIDLFAGIGGFHHALAELGGECVFASDLDANCRKVYKSTWPGHPDEALIGDIRLITRRENGSDRPLSEIAAMVPDHDVLCAGFPCQPFSKSGLQQGILDKTRGTLFHDIMEIAKAKRPRYIILENVRNLAGPRHTDTFNTIIESLRECGYRVSSEPVIFSPHLLPPELDGRPQIRERVFFLAEYVGARAVGAELETGIRQEPVGGWDPNRWRIEDWLIDDVEIPNLSDYRLLREDRAAIDAWQAFVKGIDTDDLPGFPIWVDFFTVRPRFPADAPEWKRDFIRKNAAFYRAHKSFIDGWLRRSWIRGRDFRVADFIASRRKFEWQARIAQPKRANRDLWQLAIHLRPSGVRVKPLTYLPTLVAITQTSVIGPRKRHLTPVEVGRLQGIPDRVFPEAGIDDKHAYRQAGNAVNVGAVKYVASALFESTGAPWASGESTRENRSSKRVKPRSRA